MRLNRQGGASLIVVVTGGVMMAIGLLAMQQSFVAVNRRTVFQINMAEGMNAAELAAWQQVHKIDDETTASSIKQAISIESSFIEKLRRYKEGHFMRFMEGTDVCGSTHFDPLPNVFKICLADARGLAMNPMPPSPVSACPVVPHPTGTVSLVDKFSYRPPGEFNEVMMTPIVARLTPADTHPLIFAVAYRGSREEGYAEEGRLFALEVRTSPSFSLVRKYEWSSGSSSSPVPVLSPAVGRLGVASEPMNNQVVYIGNDLRVYAIRSDFSGTAWVSSRTIFSASNGETAHVRGPLIVDLENDGSVEVVAGVSVLNGATGTSKFDLASFSRNTSSDENDSDYAPGVYHTITFDVDLDGKSEIISTRGIHSGADGSLLCRYQSNGRPKIYNMGAGVMRPNDAYATVIGVSDWCDPRGGQTWGCSPSLSPRILAYHYNGTPGSLCVEDFDINPSAGMGGGSINIANFDSTPELEFSIATDSRFTAFRANGARLWQRNIDDFTSAVTGSTVFDLNGDGVSEILYNDQRRLYVFDGPTGRTIYQVNNGNGTQFEYPVVVDLDEDGHAEIVVSSNDLMRRWIDSSYPSNPNPGIRVFTNPTNDWIGTRSIWNQYGYHALNVNDDGSVTGINKNTIWGPQLPAEYLVGYHNNIPKPGDPTCAMATPTPTPPVATPTPTPTPVVACTPRVFGDERRREGSPFDIREFVNAETGREVIDDAAGYRPETALKVCQMAGANTVLDMNNRAISRYDNRTNYDSPDNNGLSLWNPSTNRWDRYRADRLPGNGGSSWLAYLKCGCQ